VPVTLAPGQDLTGVTCPAGGPCLAFAQDAKGSALAEVSETGARTPLPEPIATPGQSVSIRSLTCPARVRCFGLGTANVAAGQTTITGGTRVAETYDGTAFSLGFAGLPIRLDGYACRPTFCMLVGSHARRAAAARWDWPTTTAHN
jgi:hypothetical protein